MKIDPFQLPKKAYLGFLFIGLFVLVNVIKEFIYNKSLTWLTYKVV